MTREEVIDKITQHAKDRSIEPIPGILGYALIVVGDEQIEASGVPFTFKGACGIVTAMGEYVNQISSLLTDAAEEDTPITFVHASEEQDA